jgi:hypothetical protein
LRELGLAVQPDRDLGEFFSARNRESQVNLSSIFSGAAL